MAYQFMAVAEKFGDVQILHTALPAPSILYELAKPSTPDDAGQIRSGCAFDQTGNYFRFACSALGSKGVHNLHIGLPTRTHAPAGLDEVGCSRAMSGVGA